MKKQVITSLALIALTTPLVAMANIGTNEVPKVGDNPTELNIKTKNITENLNRARDSLLLHDGNSHDNPLWSYRFEDVIIIIPDISGLYLNDRDLSSDPGYYREDNTFRVGLRMNIKMKHSFSWDDNNNSAITNSIYNPLHLSTDKRLHWDEGSTYRAISKNGIDSLGQEWTYDLSSINDYLMRDHYFVGSNLTEVESLVGRYKETVKPLIVNGTVSWKEGTPATTITEYSESVEIVSDSKNKISVYGQRFHSYNQPPNDTLFEEKYLIETDTFETKTINKAKTGLSGGEIAGIVVGSIAGAALIGGTTFGIIKLKKPKIKPSVTNT